MRLEDALHLVIPLLNADSGRDGFLSHPWSGAALADRHRWRSLALYGADVAGAKVYVPQPASTLTPTKVVRPELCVAALLDLHSYLVIAAVPVLDEVPVVAGELAIAERSLTMVDERLAEPAFLLAIQGGDDGRLRHWLAPAGDPRRWRVVKPIDERGGDFLVEMRVPWSHRLPDSAPYTLVRMIRYQRPGYPNQAFITSLVDAHAWPRHELIAIHSERWVAGPGQPRKVAGKRALLGERDGGSGSSNNGGAAAGAHPWGHLWAALWAYNLVREVLVACAADLGIEPGAFDFAAVAGHLDVETLQAAVARASVEPLAELTHVAADLIRGPTRGPVRLHIEPRV